MIHNIGYWLREALGCGFEFLFLAAYFVAGADIGKFTVKAAEDVRTLNKIVHFRPSCNFLNINELATLWGKKIGRTLARVVVSEDDLLAAAEGISTPP